MKITFIYQKPSQDRFSIAKVFNTVRQYLPDEVRDEVFIPRYVSRGIFTRIYDIFEVMFHQNEINHITGDVHFLTYLLKKKRTVLTICDVMHEHVGVPLMSRLIISFFWYVIPLRRAGYITTISEASKREIVSLYKFNPDKITVIPVPLAPGFTAKAKKFNTRKPIILQIGTAPNKNLLNLFKALKGLKCQLYLVGHPKPDQLQELKKNKIDFKNFTNLSENDIVKKYQECDLVSFASTYEGFGMPIIEGNAVGRPVVTSNIAPMTEVGGDAACFVDPLDPKSIRQGIERVINDEKFRDRLVKNGFKNAKRFDPRLIAKMYMRIYRAIAKANSKS